MLQGLQDNCHVLQAMEGFAISFFGYLSRFSTAKVIHSTVASYVMWMIIQHNTEIDIMFVMFKIMAMYMQNLYVSEAMNGNKTQAVNTHL